MGSTQRRLQGEEPTEGKLLLLSILACLRDGWSKGSACRAARSTGNGIAYYKYVTGDPECFWKPLDLALGTGRLQRQKKD